MTEYSKNSRNMKAETVSNTGGQSGQGPTHPYSDHSSSPSQYSQGQSGVRSGVGEGEGFELTIQYIMPLVGALKDENEQLKQQREQVRADMQQLGQLSQGLLQENQQLRAHHALRTRDIRKLLETISINTHEDISDINHQAFLLKETNHALVKNIEAEMRAANAHAADLAQAQADLDGLHSQTHQDQQAIRDLQIKNKQLFYRCQELRRQAEMLEPAGDNQAVHAVLLEVVDLRNRNKQDLLRAKSLLLEHREEKPFIEESHASVAQQNRQLKAEEQELRDAARAGDSRLEELRIAYAQTVEKFADSFRSYEKAKNQLAATEEQLVNTRQAISHTNANAAQSTALLKQLAQDKEALRKKIAAKKQTLSLAQGERLEVKEKQAREVKAEVSKIREEMGKSVARLNEELTKKIGPDASAVSRGIAAAKEEYAQVAQEVQELEESMRKLENPRKEIIRLEYQLKKLGFRRN